MHDFDVAVVGAGPAGSTAARVLAQGGLSVALLEKEIVPRHKVCGGGVSGHVRQMLDFDIAPVVRDQCCKIEVSLASTDLTSEAKRDGPIISMVMRSEFDALLVDKAREAGVKLFHGFRVEGLDRREDSLRLTGSSGEICARYVIAADGATSTVARLGGWESHGGELLYPAVECELSTDDSTQHRFEGVARFDLCFAPKGYGWAFPKGNHLGIGVGSAGKRQKNLKTLLTSDYFRCLEVEGPEKLEIKGAVIPAEPRKETLARGRIFLVGDAAGLADPLSGEGISSAVFSGRQAAESILEAGSSDASRAENLYQQRLSESLLPGLHAARRVAKYLFALPQPMLILVLKRYHGELAERLAQVYMGERNYKDFTQGILRRLKLK